MNTTTHGIVYALIAALIAFLVVAIVAYLVLMVIGFFLPEVQQKKKEAAGVIGVLAALLVFLTNIGS